MTDRLTPANERDTCARFSAAVGSLQRAEKFTAWRVSEGSKQGYAIDVSSAPELSDAISDVKLYGGLQHKDKLFIRHDTPRGSTLHCWHVKRKSQPRYVRGEDGLSHPIYDLDLAELFSLAVDAFEPTRPFDAFRDDPVGRDLTLVDGL